MKHWFSDLRAFQRDPLDFMVTRGTASASSLERVHLGPTPVWLVTDPAMVKPVLKAPEHEIDKGRLVYKLRKVLGVSSLSLSGEAHRQRRALLHTTFAKGAANQYVPEMTAVICRLIGKLMREPSFDAHAITARLSLRLVSLTMFGKDVLSEEDEEVIVQAVDQVEDDLADEMFSVMPLMPWTRRRRDQKRAEACAAMGEVVKRVRQRAPSTSVVHALESLGLTDDEVRDEVLTMILAGYHTTGNAAAWLLYFLATVPGLSGAIAAEAEDLADASGIIPASRLAAGRTSLAAVKETLRLYPSAHWFARDAKADIQLGDSKLRRGDAILIPPWHFHRSTRFWNEPEQFRLDRDFGTPAFLPFGAGPRVCVGMGLAMLELQLIALEFSAATELRVLSSVPAADPKPSITLLPPPIEMSVAARLGRHAGLGHAHVENGR